MNIWGGKRLTEGSLLAQRDHEIKCQAAERFNPFFQLAVAISEQAPVINSLNIV